MKNFGHISAIAVLSVLTLATPSVASEQTETERVDRTVSIRAGGQLRLKNFSGKVTITGSNRADVVVHAVRRAPRERLDNIKLEVLETASGVSIEANKKDPSWRDRNNNVRPRGRGRHAEDVLREIDAPTRTPARRETFAATSPRSTGAGGRHARRRGVLERRDREDVRGTPAREDVLRRDRRDRRGGGTRRGDLQRRHRGQARAGRDRRPSISTARLAAQPAGGASAPTSGRAGRTTTSRRSAATCGFGSEARGATSDVQRATRDSRRREADAHGVITELRKITKALVDFVIFVTFVQPSAVSHLAPRTSPRASHLAPRTRASRIAHRPSIWATLPGCAASPFSPSYSSVQRLHPPGAPFLAGERAGARADARRHHRQPPRRHS